MKAACSTRLIESKACVKGATVSLLSTIDRRCLLCDFVENFQRAPVPLLSTSKVFLRELHLKQMIVFSDIIGHLRSSICSLLAACPVPDCGLSHLHGYKENTAEPETWPPCRTHHVNHSNILLPKLTSFHLASDFTRCLLYEKEDYESLALMF